MDSVTRSVTQFGVVMDKSGMALDEIVVYVFLIVLMISSPVPAKTDKKTFAKNLQEYSKLVSKTGNGSIMVVKEVTVLLDEAEETLTNDKAVVLTKEEYEASVKVVET